MYAPAKPSTFTTIKIMNISVTPKYFLVPFLSPSLIFTLGAPLGLAGDQD